jgi:hypothetical protein
MRTAILAAAAVLAASAAQAQQAPTEQQAALPATGQAVYDIVAADRETAWRINRVTGDVTICRIDTTGGLDSVRARCSPASMQAGGAGQQQSTAPAGAPNASAGGDGAR